LCVGGRSCGIPGGCKAGRQHLIQTRLPIDFHQELLYNFGNITGNVTGIINIKIIISLIIGLYPGGVKLHI
jgi:hypothetical protein